MNTVVPGMSMESLLNLDTLTEEERTIILSVLRKDDELKKTQDKKIGQLKLEIQGIRMKSVLRNGDDLSKICARCHFELGFLFNRGDLCPKCHFRVCRACQEQVLGGTWLCMLCHKQRQLRFLTEEWSTKGKKTKKTGTELVKASMMKKRRPGRVENEASQGDKSKRVQNGSAYRNKKEAENERIEYPNDSDRRKLSQLFDSFKLSKSSDKSDDSDTKQEISVKKLSTKRYDDSEESSSSDSEGSPDAVPSSFTSVADAHSSENVSRPKNNTRGVLQRNYSDDSDQTAMSDETPFLKNAGSTETQIRVDIHSDSSGTPQQIKRVVKHQTSDQIKPSKSNHIKEQVVRTESISSYRSTSPEIIDTPGAQKRQAYWQNRSPSPYSFDSIPSSHADSPLPKKRFSSEIHQRDSDSDSRISGISGVSGSGEHSGTESAVKDSGEEEYTVEELSKIRFRRVSRKYTRSDDSPENSQSADSEVHQRGLTGKGRVVTVDLPEEKGRVQVSEISINDIEQDIDLDDDFVNLDLVPNLPQKYGEGFDKLEFSADKRLKVKSSLKSLDVNAKVGQDKISKGQQKSQSPVTLDPKRATHREDKVDSEFTKSVDDTPIGSISERRRKLEQAMKQEWLGKDLEIEKADTLESHSDHVREEDMQKKEEINKKSPSKGASKDPSKILIKNSSTGSVEGKLKEERISSTISKDKSKPRKQATPSLDTDFDEIFNLAVADLSVDESTTDMSDTGSITRAKGKKIKKLMKKRKMEKKERKLSDNDEIDGNVNLKKETNSVTKEEVDNKEKVLPQSSQLVQRDRHQQCLGSEQDLRGGLQSDYDHEHENNESVGNVLSASSKECYPEIVVQEEIISPVRVVREELSSDKLNKIEKAKIVSENQHAIAKKGNMSEHSETESKKTEVIEEAGGKGDNLLNITQEMIESGEIDLDKLSLGEIRVLMKHNILPMDEELMSLIDEEFVQNRQVIPATSFDSDELSIIHEESEPSDSDNSNGEIQNQDIHTPGANNCKSANFKFCIPEVIVEEYVEDENQDFEIEAGESFVHDSESNVMDSASVSATYGEDQQGVPTSVEEKIIESSNKVNEKEEISLKSKSGSEVSIEELQKFYQDVKKQVALETYMETQKTKIVDPSYDSDPEDDHVFIDNKSKSLTGKEMATNSEGTGQDKIDNIQVSLFGAKSYDVNKMSEVILQGGDNEDLQTDILQPGISAVTRQEPDMNNILELEETDKDDVDIPSIIGQGGGMDSRSVSQDEITSKSNIENKLESQSPSILKDEICRSSAPETDSSISKTPVTTDKYNKRDNASYRHVDTPYTNLHGDNSLIGQSDLSADITLTPTEQSIDSDNTFCATLEGNLPEKENSDISGQRLLSAKKSDIVGQSLSREVLVKQWLSSKTEMREDNQNSQSDSSEITTENPALNSVTPACDLDLSSRQTGALPKLNMQEWKETETDSITKLSPRASSEGSASFEDSGHVSGASTQENTPEHRRTGSLQSQTSMGSSRLSTLTDKESEEDADIDELVRSHKSQHSSLGGSRGNLLSAFTESKESIISYYSNAGDVDYGKIPITGDIEFGLDYNYRTGTLEINIVRCKGLAPADTKRNRSDPYVKTYLLPDKTRGGKRKSKIKKHTLNPVFNETLRYLISKSELENRTVWITVWHNDRFGRNDFLGEVTINFDYYRFGDSAPKWYKLQERFEQPMSLLAYKGDIILCLKYVPPEKVNRDVDSPPSPSRKRLRKPVSSDQGQLHVMIKEARNLTAVRSNGHSDPFCKGQLQPDKEKQKTHVIKKECNPVWNCTMVFDNVTVASLREKSLELTIWDYDKITSNDFLGGVRLNLGIGRSYGKNVDWMDARGEEISLWQAMLDRPNFWIDGALVLRPSMSKRK